MIDYDKIAEKLGLSKKAYFDYHGDTLHAKGISFAQAWQEKVKMHLCPTKTPSIHLMAAYISPTSGKYIETTSQRKSDLKQSNSRPYEGFEVELQEAQRRNYYEEQKNDEILDQSLHQAIQQLPEKTKRDLGLID
jgi:DNA-directed RNA polymerase specialized sigma subunit